MKINLELLKNWGACSDGESYFSEKFPNGADYAAVITQCDLDDKEDYHQWLFCNAFAHLDAKELGEITQGETAQISGYAQKGLELLTLLQQEIKDTNTISKDAESRLAASGVRSRLAASGDWSRLAASGDWSRLAASGAESRLAASGAESRLAASGDWSQLAASGVRSQLAASGDWSRLAASGVRSQLAASGAESRLAASGVRSQLAASGVRSQLAASGAESRLAASGDWSRLAASGDWSRLAASGENSIIASAGLDSNFIIGKGGCAAIPYKDENGKVRFAIAYEGENIKADTWYEVNTKGKFVEVEA
ncbi:hypothetical protein [Acinetobacter tianfuensis]|uniref:Uncharacterized protein n=1 Tax=Acinetobacter tianfuensis TaxID=2419603 RepID=A0A3A8EUS3_9GAMM|nr:hypothetical protein [Acinetobacter tianfuensis]RKG33764.1 hypothetical protein D7V32_02910 [Acinetobacter tianfuensis]